MAAKNQLSEASRLVLLLCALVAGIVAPLAITLIFPRRA